MNKRECGTVMCLCTDNAYFVACYSAIPLHDNVAKLQTISNIILFILTDFKVNRNE